MRLFTLMNGVVPSLWSPFGELYREVALISITVFLTLNMNTAQRFELSVTVNNNSPIQDYEMTRGFNPFTVCTLTMKCAE